MNVPSTDLLELIRKRKSWVKVNQDNGFNDGIERLLTNLYPDTAHFAFELLQNAEDAGANNVVFTLRQNQLFFEHNGRPFNVSDIESITNIANSAKKDDDSSIGKFGIGFKSVFSYTTEPEIESGQYHFRIQNMVVPVLVDSPSHSDTETHFTFPFNHPRKSPKKAFAEIQKQLCDLPKTTLLFLNNIESIKVCIEGDSLRETIRTEFDNVVDIIFLHGEKETPLKFFRMDKKVEIIDSDEDDKRKECRIAAAFCLETSKNGKLQIVPCDQGLVSIFFHVSVSIPT